MSKKMIALATSGVLFAALVGAIGGTLTTATSGIIVAGGLHLLGFIAMETARTVFILFVGAGAVLGGLGAALQVLATALVGGTA